MSLVITYCLYDTSAALYQYGFTVLHPESGIYGLAGQVYLLIALHLLSNKVNALQCCIMATHCKASMDTDKGRCCIIYVCAFDLNFND